MGSYAKVSLVQDTLNKQFYAMKELNKSRLKKKREREHIQIEKEILTTLPANPFIVKCFRTFQTKTKLYFILEYCHGGELFTLLDKKQTLSENDARFYAAQIILALEHLHKNNILYRDLKPENILIAANGYLKITDFGLSQNNYKENPVQTVCGTPEYLAPELFKK